MSAGGYKITNQQAVHFVTFTVVEWIDVFTRPIYKKILLDSIRYCQASKGMKLHGWCLMTNHIHLLIASMNKDLSGLLRDFKKFTSSKLLDTIANNKKESRKDWMMKVFNEQGSQNSRNGNWQFWRQENGPKECHSSEFTVQKLEYMHQNPVMAEIVDRAEDYKYSSAKDYATGTKCGLLDISFI